MQYAPRPQKKIRGMSYRETRTLTVVHGVMSRRSSAPRPQVPEAD